MASVEKPKTESSESHTTTATVKEECYNDEEMESALLLLERQFANANKMALRIADALNHRNIALQKLIAYLGGEDAASTFLRTIVKPRWLMKLFSAAFGSTRVALDCIEAYRKAEVGSKDYNEAASKLIDVAGNENFVKAFVQKFGPLKDLAVNNLAAWLERSVEDVNETLYGCLEGEVIPMRRLENVTGAKTEVILGLLEAIKHCDEVEVEGSLKILHDNIIEKTKGMQYNKKKLLKRVVIHRRKCYGDFC